MGKGGESSGTSTTESSTNLPKWITQQAGDNLGEANRVAQGLRPVYGGQRVADMNGGQLSAITGMNNAVGMANPGYNQALSTLNGLQGFNPADVSAGQLADTSLAPYMNPYTRDVIDASMKTMDQQRLQGLNSIGDSAAGSKAFGGSRHGVAEGVTNAQSALGAGQLAAGLNSQNFLQAQGAAGQDIAARYAADAANQQAGIAGAGLRMNAANSGAAVAGQQQSSMLESLMASLQGNNMLQAQHQSRLDADRQLDDELRQHPVQQLGIRTSVLGQTPYGTTTTGQQQQPVPKSDGTSKALGTAATVVGIAGSVAAMF
jgi:hypothetical protein